MGCVCWWRENSESSGECIKHLPRAPNLSSSYFGKLTEIPITNVANPPAGDSKRGPKRVSRFCIPLCDAFPLSLTPLGVCINSTAARQQHKCGPGCLERPAFGANSLSLSGLWIWQRTVNVNGRSRFMAVRVAAPTPNYCARSVHFTAPLICIRTPICDLYCPVSLN